MCNNIILKRLRRGVHVVYNTRIVVVHNNNMFVGFKGSRSTTCAHSCVSSTQRRKAENDVIVH